MTWNIPRLVIGAPHGRSGKTTITVGLLAGLRAKGFNVQPFKKGPDFIDPSWLSQVAGRPCRNLDRFWMTRETLTHSFINGSQGADMSIVEGAMGLYDGVDLAGTGSTAEVAKTLKAPVILVVDTTRMTRSVAAMVMGYQVFDRDVSVCGVILNKVARKRHAGMLQQAVEEYCGIPVLGMVPKGVFQSIPDRHLGLIPAGEYQAVEDSIAHAGKVISEHVDLDRIVEMARSAEPLAVPETGLVTLAAPWKKGANRQKQVRIGVFRDKVFSFYYRENLEALEDLGAELITIDSCSDSRLPDVDALYIGGGFPEVFAQELEANVPLRHAVKNAAEQGMPIYAECGGLMYLGRSITWNGVSYEMTDIMPFDVLMEAKPQGHGYTVMNVKRDNPYFPVGTPVKGHEFHHSKLINIDPALDHALEVERGHGIDGKMDGVVYKNVFAGYNHVHVLSQPSWASGLVQAGADYRLQKRSGYSTAISTGS